MEELKVFEETRELDPHLACAIVEGFCEGEGAKFVDQVKAWAYLIRTGMCWNLQGWYGRTAQGIIDAGSISEEGEIDWDMVNEITDEDNWPT